MFGKNAKRQRADDMAASGYRADFTGLDPELQELMLLEEAERTGAVDPMASRPGDLDPELEELMLLEEAERTGALDTGAPDTGALDTGAPDTMGPDPDLSALEDLDRAEREDH
jgi:hypothetical protein